MMFRFSIVPGNDCSRLLRNMATLPFRALRLLLQWAFLALFLCFFVDRFTDSEHVGESRSLFATENGVGGYIV